LQQLLRQQEWVKGAVNYDEDLHFSTYYLRASCADQTRSLYPGYSTIVAFYTGFNECYYLLKSECLLTATALVRNALRRPEWLPRIVKEIYRRSDLLTHVFDPQTTPARLKGLADDRLLGLYRRHAARQRALYRVARLPEALDRGVNHFTNYLVEHLRQMGVPAAEVGDVFAALSQPLVPSVLAQEILEFDRIVNDVLARPRAAQQIAGLNGRAHLFLEPTVLARLEEHREKWQFLPYHGYGRRELASSAHYLARLTEQLRHPRGRAGSADLLRRFEEGRTARQQAQERLQIDPAHRRLFEVYPEIGAAKLYRRHAQLRNFYYLDLLLADIARRLGVAEWVVRCMLPEEVEHCLQTGAPVPPAALERSPDCMYAHFDGEEEVVGGKAARQLARLFQKKVQGRASGPVLNGVVASQGKVTGRCKVIIRADHAGANIAAGTIIVSEATDPDLLGLLRQAGGVLTEQGGVTSHAAIICRELGIPTIIGIEGLLDRVHDGDLLEVDAFKGTVTVVPPSSGPHICPSGPPGAIGNKAHNLTTVRSLGFPVPEFEVLPFDAKRGAPARPAALDWLQPGDRLAIRSSAVGEDGETGSLAGEFSTLLNVSPEQLDQALGEFVSKNHHGKSGHSYRGGIIVQRMIDAQAGGVCLTRDARAGSGESVILEMTAGGNQGVTGGTALTDRVVVDRLTGDIVEADRRCPRLREAPVDVAGLVQQFLTLEAHFGQPLDIEWALAEGKLYILQVRPIVQRGERGA
jgi:phosphohistidine swiveling domain-containing protein